MGGGAVISPSSSDVLRRARFFIRRQLFIEMCHSSEPMQALQYLQNDVSSFVNHDDEVESKQFRELTQYLFKWPGKRAGISSSGNDILALGLIEKSRSTAMTSSGNMDVQAGGMASGGLFLYILKISEIADGESESQTYFNRTALYEKLLEYFPSSMKEPKGNLVDLVDLI